MMEQAPDDLDPTLLKSGKALVGPTEVELVRMVGGDAFPQERVADRRDAEPCDQVDVRRPAAMAGLGGLVAPPVADPYDRAFRPAPEFERRAPGAMLDGRDQPPLSWPL